MYPNLQGYSHRANHRSVARLGSRGRGFWPWETMRCHASQKKIGGPTWLKILFNSLFSLSARPENKLPPPLSTTLLSKTWRMSGSHEVTEALMSWGKDFGRLGLVACVHPLNKPSGGYWGFISSENLPVGVEDARKIVLQLQISRRRSNSCTLLEIRIALHLLRQRPLRRLSEPRLSRKMNEIKAPTVHSIPGLGQRQYCVSTHRLLGFRPSSANCS